MLGGKKIEKLSHTRGKENGVDHVGKLGTVKRSAMLDSKSRKERKVNCDLMLDFLCIALCEAVKKIKVCVVLCFKQTKDDRA